MNRSIRNIQNSNIWESHIKQPVNPAHGRQLPFGSLAIVAAYKDFSVVEITKCVSLKRIAFKV